MNAATDFMRGIWYVAMAGRRLKPGKMAGRVLFGEPMLFGRRTDGSVFAVRDICPHRGVPLRYGIFDGETVRCRYHGWRFGGDGRCVEIPSLLPDHGVNLDRIRVPAYPCVEKQGLIWVLPPDDGQKAEASPGKPPTFPDFGANIAPKADIRLIYDCGFDDAAFGLIDPAHIAYVHSAWWLSQRKPDKLKVKVKRFAPCERGWKSAVEEAPKTGAPNWLFGEDVSTEIQTWLPGFRVERIFGDRHRIVNLLAITPIDAERTQMIQCIWWSPRGLDALRPVVERAARHFLSQDGVIATLQREGLKYGPQRMLVPDADTQMRWWMKLKAEWVAHRREGRPFKNPIEPATLRYRS